MPVIIGLLTIPGFFSILHDAPSKPFRMAFLPGAAYSFGGMSYGKAINHIGYSLTYTLAIGISVVIGTIFPIFVLGEIGSYFSKQGGGIILSGMILSLMGVIVCGWSGIRKENAKMIVSTSGCFGSQFYLVSGSRHQKWYSERVFSGPDHKRTENYQELNLVIQLLTRLIQAILVKTNILVVNSYV